MEYSSILNEVVKQLEGEANRSRIKKILFCAARGKWENDARKIEECDLRDLVLEVWENNSNLEQVNELLGRIVSKVNKKTEYGLVAKKIVENLALLYANEQEATMMMETTISNLWESPVETQLDEPLNEPEEEEIYQDRDPGQLFDVRQKIMQSSNPLKAKILIFSAVERQFNFSDRDWLNLKTRTLDNLLRQLFNVCKNITDLESNLYSAASILEDADENTQIASTIIEAFKGFYDRESAPVSVDNSRKAMEEEKEEEEEGPTYHEGTIREENIDDSSFDLGEITLINQQEAPSYNPQFNNSLPSLGFTNSGNVTGSTAKQVEEDEEFEETIAMASPQRLNLETIKPEVTTEELETKPQQEPKVVENKNILESIKQKLSLEEEIKALVENGVSAMTKSMEQEFSKLETVLDSSLAGEEEEKYLSMKYQALGQFVGRAIEMSSKFEQILKQLELEERKTRGLTDRKDFLAASLDNSDTSSATQQKTIDLAKEGHPKAIAFIINQYLKTTGVSTIAGWKGDCLHIILESEQFPNQQTYAPFVEEKIISLQSNSLKNVKIHGRTSGNKSIIWTKVVQY